MLGDDKKPFTYTIKALSFENQEFFVGEYQFANPLHKGDAVSVGVSIKQNVCYPFEGAVENILHRPTQAPYEYAQSTALVRFRDDDTLVSLLSGDL